MFFVRHLAKVPKSTFAAYPGCLAIAAGGLKPIDADASLFSFEDVSCYDATGLALDLDAVTLRFEKRTLDNKSDRKPNKSMLGKMNALANHVKNIAAGFMRARRSGTEGVYNQVAKNMAKVTMPSLEKFFASDDAPCKISRSVLHGYLSGPKYADEPYASATRFGYKAYTRMNVLDAVSAVCTKKFKNKVNQVDGMDASRLYMKIVKFLPQEIRRMLYVYPHIVDKISYIEYFIHITLTNLPSYDIIFSVPLGEGNDGILLQEIMASTD